MSNTTRSASPSDPASIFRPTNCINYVVWCLNSKICEYITQYVSVPPINCLQLMHGLFGPEGDQSGPIMMLTPSVLRLYLFPHTGEGWMWETMQGFPTDPNAENSVWVNPILNCTISPTRRLFSTRISNSALLDSSIPRRDV